MTIGNFDGVHRGHQYLLDQVTSLARDHNVPSLVVTFEPHPIAVLRPEQAPPRISTPESKVAELRRHGIDEIAVIPFDREFASLSPETFLAVLTEWASPVAVLVGEDFRFGRMRAGDFQTIVEFGKQHGFSTHAVEELTDESGIVSSTRIRGALLAGDIDTAAELLGRRYQLSGQVEHGMARGRDLGYPTANLDVPNELCIPSDGIFAGFAHLDERSNGPRQAMIYIGTSPTFGERERRVEVNILDYRGDLYSRELGIEFVAFVRGDRVFESPELLSEQMGKDEAASRSILSGVRPEAISKH